ncbi:MAG: potassium channel protein [Eubacteriales bacterium]|nr:potassium channel protein [Eubacteriales bacterium]
MKSKRKIVTVLFLLLAVILVGTAGYMALSRVGFVDAFYMTIITISTVGFGEVGTVTEASRMFTVIIIFSGIAVLGYGVSELVKSLFEGELKTAWRKKRMQTKIQELTAHYIICGAGDVGLTVINRLKGNGADFVVIEENEKRVESLSQSNVLTIEGDATQEEVLQKAGIMNAKGLVCTLDTDAENVFTVLTARQMNNDVYIVSKAIEPSAHNKLLKAGANKTISPSEIGGQRIAGFLLRPSVMAYLDVITHAGDRTLDLEEVAIPARSAVSGKKLSEIKIPEKTGLIILALKRKGESRFKFNPGSGEVLNPDDTVVVLGEKEQIKVLQDMIGA